MESLEWYRLFVRMVAASILVHDALYLCRDGKSYLLNCILPTFGLHLGPRGKLAVHGGLLLSCLGMIHSPEQAIFYPCALLFLSLKIASYSLRLANHMIFAWFLLLLLCVSAVGASGAATNAVPTVALGAQGLTLILYFFAFFHKLNREYFVFSKSCATAFVNFFCMDRNITRPGLLRFYRYFGVYGTVLIETMIPLMLCFESTRLWGLMLGIVFHFILALMGIVNFSMFMYTGLLAFLRPAELQAALQMDSGIALGCLIALSIAVVLIVWRWTPRLAAANCAYLHRQPAWLIQTAFGIATGCFLYACGLALQLAAQPAAFLWHQLDGAQQLGLSLFFAAFFLNGLGPYLGYKTEFSFAMFSNLRLEPWSHLLIPEYWRLFRRAQYIEVQHIEGLPTMDQVKGNRAAELAVFVLSQPRDYYYSRYFFREALRILHTGVVPAARVKVAYLERGALKNIDGFDTAQLGFCLPINRYPFVMPRDPDASHSEQGCLVPRQGERQLF